MAFDVNYAGANLQRRISGGTFQPLTPPKIQATSSQRYDDYDYTKASTMFAQLAY